jgi:hypothetical protein
LVVIGDRIDHAGSQSTTAYPDNCSDDCEPEQKSESSANGEAGGQARCGSSHDFLRAFAHKREGGELVPSFMTRRVEPSAFVDSGLRDEIS